MRVAADTQGAAPLELSRGGNTYEMAPHERSGMSLRWEFVPVKDQTTGAVNWRWLTYTQTGKVFAESNQSFDTVTDCIEDAKDHGYHPPAG